MNIVYRFLTYKALGKIYNGIFGKGGSKSSDPIPPQIPKAVLYEFALDGSAKDLRRFNRDIKKMIEVYENYTVRSLKKDQEALSEYVDITEEIDEFLAAYSTADGLVLDDFDVTCDYGMSVKRTIDKYIGLRNKFS